MATIGGGSTEPGRAVQGPQAALPAADPRRDAAPVRPALTGDSLKLSGQAPAAGESSTGQRIDHLAHSTHTPHGLMHTVEAGERAVHAAGRLARQAGRVASTASEAAGEAHHLAEAHGHAGIFARLEAAGSRAAGWLGGVVGGGIRALPGGARALEAAGSATAAVGRAAEGLVAGTRLAGAGGRLTAAMGGRLPVIGAALGGVIAVADVRGALRIIDDPASRPRDRVVAAGQAGLSVVSGVTGVGALAAAGAVALGLTAPVSVPLLLGASAITGLGAFAASFLLPAHS
ncbi:MAG: hypothetical protein VKS61_18760 [Candidatus Sericytochromatia bacterium]|nr:hypothetical protein [Candidatus Sericytochromatia bacterium]